MEAVSLPVGADELQAAPQADLTAGMAGGRCRGAGARCCRARSRVQQTKRRGRHAPASAAQPATYFGGQPGRQSFYRAAELATNPSSLTGGLEEPRLTRRGTLGICRARHCKVPRRQAVGPARSPPSPTQVVPLGSCEHEHVSAPRCPNPGGVF